MDLSSLERYRPLIDDWDAFAAAHERPIRPTIWTNTLRVSPQEVAEYLARDGMEAEHIAWLPGGFRLPVGSQPGKNFGRLLGLFHIQEETSMMPIPILDPQPGERILDLCAAPGNKTVQASVRMENRGTVIANDLNHQRIGLIYQSAERLGVTNVALYDRDASNLPRSMGLYDRVLADVPCSCEGTARRNPGILQRLWRPGFRQSSQVAILHKAIQLCQPGGRIVYSTCTFAPEENEYVVNAVLRKPPAGSRVRLLPVRIPGLTTCAGLTEWKEDSFDPSLTNAMRIYPHQNDTGGFFIALIEKLAEQDSGNTEEIPRPRRRVTPEDAEKKRPDELTKEIDGEPYLADLESRFGIPRHATAGQLIFRSSSKRASIVSADLELPAKPPTWALGMPFYSTKRIQPRPASAMIRRLGRFVTRNTVEVDDAQIQDLLMYQEVRLAPEQLQGLEGRGYVVLRHRGYVVTVARPRKEEEGEGDRDGVMFHAVIPKLWAQALEKTETDF